MMGFPYSPGDVLTAADMNAIGSWTSFTPSWTNLTPGDATEQWKYSVVNEILFVYGRTTFGSTTAVTGTPLMQVPYGSGYDNIPIVVGNASYYDDSANDIFHGVVSPFNATDVKFWEFNVSGSLITQANVIASSPFTWATADQIRATFTLRLT